MTVARVVAFRGRREDVNSVEEGRKTKAWNNSLEATCRLKERKRERKSEWWEERHKDGGRKEIPIDLTSEVTRTTLFLRLDFSIP